ncbi:MAG: hypothetical protein ACW99Q_29080 [Candidatus Kariarchaeaceae archaeon]|jgi:hypothetical protein
MLKRRPLSVVLSLILFFTLFNSQVLIISADLPRHINPDEFQVEDLSASHIISLYSILFSHIIDGNFTLAHQWIDWASEIYTPEELSLFFKEYNYLINKEVDFLNNISQGEELFLLYLDQFNLTAAFSTLEDFNLNLLKVNQTHHQISLKTEQLSSIVDTSTEPLIQQLHQIQFLINEKIFELEIFIELYQRAVQLKENITDIDDLLSELPELFEILRDNPQFLEFDGFEDLFLLYPGLIEIIPEHPDLIVNIIESVIEQPLRNTHLTLSVNDTAPTLGTSILVEGFLLDSSLSGIPEQLISIYLNGTLISSTSSNLNGYYSYNLKIPYIYLDNLTINTHYEPSTNNLNKYYPTTSKLIFLYPFYYKPTIRIIAPDHVLPGEQFILKGLVSIDANPISVKLMIEAFHNSLNIFSDLTGYFSIYLETPLNIAEKETIAIQSEPNKLLGPANVTHILQILPQTIEIINQGPSFSFGNQVYLTGKVSTQQKAVSDCLIIVTSPSGKKTTRTDILGEYRISLSLPFRWIYSNVNYSVTAEPIEPMLRPTILKNKIQTVNPFTITGVPLILGYLFWYARAEKELRIGRTHSASRGTSL